MKIAIGVLIFGLVVMIGGLGLMAFSSYAIKKGCVEKIADGTLTEREREICRRHGHL